VLFAFDNKDCDTGILDEVFKEARQFAQRQKFNVFEATGLRPAG